MIEINGEPKCHWVHGGKPKKMAKCCYSMRIHLFVTWKCRRYQWDFALPDRATDTCPCRDICWIVKFILQAIEEIPNKESKTKAWDFLSAGQWVREECLVCNRQLRLLSAWSCSGSFRSFAQVGGIFNDWASIIGWWSMIIDGKSLSAPAGVHLCIRCNKEAWVVDLSLS